MHVQIAHWAWLKVLGVCRGAFMSENAGAFAHRRARPAAASDGGRCSVQSACRSARGSASASTHPAR